MYVPNKEDLQLQVVKLHHNIMMTHHPLLMTWFSMTIPLGSSIFIAGKSKARLLWRVVSWMYLMTRVMDSLLPTSMNMPAPLLLQVFWTAGNQSGMITDRNVPMRLIRCTFRAMTVVFKHDMHLIRPGHPQSTM